MFAQLRDQRKDLLLELEGRSLKTVCCHVHSRFMLGSFFAGLGAIK